MKAFVLYFFLLFVGIPFVMFFGRMASLPDDEKIELAEAAKDLKGHIYSARIVCPRDRDGHVMRVHGRSREAARRKIEAQLRRCKVTMLEGEGVPLWKETLRTIYGR